MTAEILAGIGIVTVLIVLLLFAVITERITRSITVLRHLRKRYTQPVAELTQLWERISTWSAQRDNAAGIRSADEQGYTARNEM